MTDFKIVKHDFPILSTHVHNHPLIYLDNAATTQLPRCVLNQMEEQYTQNNANVHRGIHFLSERSTARYEAARETVRSFLGAASCREIVFTAGTTDAINLVARSVQETLLHPGDEVIVSGMEHHSNLIPWQQACLRNGGVLRVIPVTDNGELDLDVFYSLLSSKTKIVAVTAVSNVLGTVNPLEAIIAAAHQVGAAVLVDAAQAMRHLPINVELLDCDFLCFSGHKIMAPAGIGVLYGKEAWLEQLQPISFGGGMVDQVSLTGYTYGKLPYRLEAGTPNYPAAIGLGCALNYVSALDRAEIAQREIALLQAYEEMLRQFPSVRILGSSAHRTGVLSFVVQGASSFDVSTLLDQLAIATRSGHHCAQPLLEHLGVSYAVRISPAFYNQFEEIPQVQAALERTFSALGVKL